jgi:hypothetical protein
MGARRLCSATLIGLALWVTACGGAGKKATAPDGGDDPAPHPKPSGDSEHDRLLAEALAKRDACDHLADVVQNAELGEDQIVNLGDSGKLSKLSANRANVAEQIADVEIPVDELGSLRDKYVGELRNMAAALGDASKAGSDKTRRKALERYRKADDDKGKVIDAINEWCANALGG